LESNFFHGLSLRDELQHLSLTGGKRRSFVDRGTARSFCENADQVAGKLRTQVASTALHHLDGFLEFIATRRLENERRGSGAEYAYGKTYIRMHGKNDELCAQTHPGEKLHGIKTVQERHRHVGENHIRLKLYR
jgi:hypothetical protein